MNSDRVLKQVPKGRWWGSNSHHLVVRLRRRKLKSVATSQALLVINPQRISNCSSWVYRNVGFFQPVAVSGKPSIFQWGNPLAGYGWGCRPHGCEAAGLHWGWKSAANIPISVRTTTMAGRDLPRQYLISRRYLRCLVSSWNGKSVPKIFSYDCFFLVWIRRPKKLVFNHGLISKEL